MSVKHTYLRIYKTGVILQGSSIKSSLFTKSGNSFSIIISESVKLEDSFGDVWCTHKIDFKKFSLKMSLIRSVLDQSFKKESSGLLDSTVFKEDLDDRIDGCFWNISIFFVCDHFSKTYCSLRVNWD